jgi:hypothetical protein
MFKLVSDDVPSIEQFMSRYRVGDPIRGHPLSVVQLISPYFPEDGSSRGASPPQGRGSSDC